MLYLYPALVVFAPKFIVFDTSVRTSGPIKTCPRWGSVACGGRVGGQEAGVEVLLRAFDEVRAEHEGMEPETFNDDATYKGGIILVHNPRNTPPFPTPPTAAESLLFTWRMGSAMRTT